MDHGNDDPRWERLWELFHECAELSPAERAERLDRECADDPELRAEVLELLREHDSPTTGLDRERGVAPGELAPGTRVGPYEIECLVGEGGMGLVYRARQTEPVARTVALKLIRPGMDSREVISRFQLERQSLAMLEHPNIARVHDAATTDAGRPYFAMEFVDGTPITTYCLERRMSVERRLELFDAICRGVQHAHQRGIIHRDLKPSNVLVTEIDGEPVPKIIDFGIARATEDSGHDRTFATELGRMVGTPEYMSPEQAGLSDAGIDTRSDVYSLGAILYELLSGCQPFDWAALRQQGFEALQRVIRDQDPPRPSARLSTNSEAATTGLDIRDVDGDLDWIVLKALEKDRDRRYDSPSSLAEDLERYRNDHPVEARPPSRIYRLKKFTRRHRLGVAAGIVVVAALVAGGTLAAIGFAQAIEEREKARLEAATAERVTDFMTEIVLRGRPGNEDFDSRTIGEVLDEMAQTLPDSLQDEPVVRGRLMAEVGWVYETRGEYDKAEPLLREGLRLLELHMGAEYPGTAGVLMTLGTWEYSTGDRESARATLERAVALLDAHADEFDPRTTNAMQVLGNVYGDLELYDEQRRLAEEVLAIKAAHPDQDEGQVGLAYYHLALAMANAGDHDEVEATLEQAIERFRRSDDQPMVAHGYNSLGIHYWNAGEFERALPFLRGALESTRRTHGEEHPYTASMFNNVGLCLLELKRYDESREFSEKSYELRLKALGPDHRDVATSELNLARLYGETGERERAIEFFERGLATRAGAMSENHRSMIKPLRRYASFLEAWDRAADAKPYLERAEVIEALKEPL